MRLKGVGNATYQRWFEQWLVALHIDDHRIVIESKLLRCFRQAIRAGRVIASRHRDFIAECLDGDPDTIIVGGDNHARGATQTGALGDAHDHRLAGYIGQRFTGQAQRRIASRNKDGKTHGAIALTARAVVVRRQRGAASEQWLLASVLTRTRPA